MKIFKHASTVSLFTGLSRILGLVREILMADFFGTSLAKSAFDVAFRIPNLFRRLFGEGALSAAFIPVFSETEAKEGRAAAKILAGRVATMLATVLTLITLAATVIITLIMTYGSPGPKTAAVLPLLRIMFPYMLFICLVALCMGILNANMKFALPAATPIILNLLWIGTLFLICPKFGDSPGEQIYGVAWGVLIAGLVQLAVQIPLLYRYDLMPKISFQWHDPHIRRILLLMGPAALGMGIHQVNVVIDGLLALAVNNWAPAALTYAERLVYLPLGIFATALGTVLLPTFSRQAAAADTGRIKTTMAASIRGLMLIMVPATVGLIVLAAPIVRLLFEHGVFNALSTVQTARALWFYAPGLVVFSLYKILTPAFYAMQDTKTPVKIGIAAVLLNLTLNITFIITWPPDYRHAGLACATVIASAANCLALAVIITRRIGSPGWLSLLASLARTSLAAALMAAAAIPVYRYLAASPGIFNTAAITGQALTLAAAIATAIFVYAGTALLICRPELRTITRRR